MLHTALIAVQAAGGVVAFVLGCLALALRPPPQAIPTSFRGYLGAMWAMVLFLVLVVATDWGTLTAGVRILFGALTLLALYVGWRGWRAFHDLQRRGSGWTGAMRASLP